MEGEAGGVLEVEAGEDLGRGWRKIALRPREGFPGLGDTLVLLGLPLSGAGLDWAGPG